MTMNRNFARRFGRFLTMAAGLLLGFNAAYAAETVTYYHTDALGTPVMESNAAGTVTYAREHKPYGEQVLGVAKNGPGFTGHLSDADTGLTYMQARYYDPVSNRFLSNDPVSADLDTAANFNRYWYANNNPYRYFDPDGRQAAQPCNDACMRMRATSDGGITGATSQQLNNRRNSPEMFYSTDPAPRIASFYGIDERQVLFDADQYNECAQNNGCWVSFNSKNETAYLVQVQTGTPPLLGVRSAGQAAKGLFGRGYPSKLNRAGKLQPYNPANGQYLPSAANPGLQMSPAGRFSTGFTEGYNEAKGSGAPGVPIGKAGSWGYMMGYVLGQIF